MDQDEKITAKFMNGDQFPETVSRHLRRDVYEKIREEAEVADGDQTNSVARINQCLIGSTTA